MVCLLTITRCGGWLWLKMTEIHVNHLYISNIDKTLEQICWTMIFTFSSVTSSQSAPRGDQIHYAKKVRKCDVKNVSKLDK